MPYADPEKQREQARQYYKLHAQERLEYRRQYIVVHKSKVAAEKHAYYLLHKDRLAQKEKARWLVVGERMREAKKIKYWSNPDYRAKVLVKLSARYLFGMTKVASSVLKIVELHRQLRREIYGKVG